MAQFGFSGIDDLILDLEAIAEIPNEVQAEMLEAQADITAAAQQRAGRAMGVDAPGSGVMLRSIKKGKVKVQDGRNVIYVTPTGTRKRGRIRTRNAEIAFVNEFGKKHQKPRPFIRTGNEQSAEEATGAAMAIYDRWLKSKNL